LVTAAKVAKNMNVEGYRIVVNNGKNAHQTVHNLYLHVIGGQPLKWPPYNVVSAQEEEQKSSVQQLLNPQTG